jgi:zinc transport system substrate-binding protein
VLKYRFGIGLFLMLGFVSVVWAELMPAAKLKMVATNYPLAYFAERIAGHRAEVNFPIPSSIDPAYWKPDGKSVRELQKADVIFLNGADYEKWLPRVALPKLKLVETSAAFQDTWLRVENTVIHRHGAGGQHSHAGTAFTTWLDFDQAAKQATAVAEALARKRPEWKSLFLENLKSLHGDLAALDSELTRITAIRPDAPLLASHPVYQYLARRYRLKLQSVHWEPHKMPAEPEWLELQKILAAHPSHWMIWEAQPSAEVVGKLKSLGVKTIVFDPCANRPESGDFLSHMRSNIENLRAAFR